jgi:orotate phosphoribosyltransferase
MAGFDQEDYHDFVLNYRSPKGENVVGFFPQKRKLASGRMSNWYWNGRVLLDYMEPMEKLAKFILDYCGENGIMPSYFLNVPEGVDKLTDYLNALLGGKQVKVRANPKEGHGDPRDKFFIGPVEHGDKVVLIEDVTTTGGSIVGTLERCLDSGLQVTTICECNRMEKAAKGRGDERVDLDMGVNEYVTGIKNAGTKHHALTTADKVLPAAFELWIPPEGVSRRSIADAIEEEYREHGVVPIRLEV